MSLPSRFMIQLPEAWPSRPGEDRILTLSGAELPGLGSGWHLETRLEALPSGQASPLGGAYGRGGILRCGDVVLRPYRRGGLARRVNRCTYLSPARFQREFLIHLALWRAGFPTLEPLGWAWRRHGWGVEGVYLTRFSDAVPWPRTWAPGVLPQVGRMLVGLGRASLWCPDLNATNLLVDAEGRALALDWDKARMDPRPDLAARYAARLLRSLQKLGAPDDVVAVVASWASKGLPSDPSPWETP